MEIVGPKISAFLPSLARVCVCVRGGGSWAGKEEKPLK